MSSEVHPRIARRLRLASRASAIVVAGIALAVFVAWLARLAPVEDTGATPAAGMKVNTALALLLAAGAVSVIHFGGGTPRSRVAYNVVASLALAIGWFTLAEYATGVSLGIDTLLAPDPQGGRMAPNTAFALVLLGTALVLDGAKTRGTRIAGEVTAIAAGLVGILGIVGHAYVVPFLYGVGEHTAMALTSAVSILGLAFAALAARPERGIASVLASDSAGGVMARRLVIPAFALPLGIGWLVIVAVRGGRASPELGLAAFSMSILVAFVGLVLSNAGLLHRADTERKLAEDRLKGESRFRALLEAAPDAIVIADREGRISILNSQAERVFGYRREELRGVPLETLIPAAPDAQPGAAIRDATGRRKDGSEFPADVRVSPLESEEGIVRTYVVRDLTDRQRMEAERLATMAQLKELERLKEIDAFKTEFINTAAHELGTPLTPIKVQLHLLKHARGATLVPAQRSAVDILDRNIERLSHLVQDMLDVARLQASRLGLVRRAIDLNQVAIDAAESFRDAAKQAGVTLETQLVPGLVVEADEKRLTQVIYNLVSNALKFTPAGGRIVVETAEAHDHAVVRVRDSGIGIAPEAVQRLFRPFSQVHDTAVANPTGTGLGLYISRGIVELHGGRLTVDSAGRGRGSTFTINIPFKAPPTRPPEAILPAPVARKAHERDVESTVAKRAKELV